MLATGLIVAYGYVMEAFMAWYSGNAYEQFMMIEPHVSGRTRRIYWMLIVCNVIVPQVLWFQRVRRSTLALLLRLAWS